MALPPQNLPLRPLQLAVRSLLLLGIIGTVLWSLGVLGALIALVVEASRPVRWPQPRRDIMLPASIMVAAIVLLGLAITMIVLSSGVRRFRRGAVTAALVIVCIHVLLSVLEIVKGIVFMEAESSDLPASSLAVVWIVRGLILLAFGQLAMHLYQSYAAIDWVAKQPPMLQPATFAFPVVMPEGQAAVVPPPVPSAPAGPNPAAPPPT